MIYYYLCKLIYFHIDCNLIKNYFVFDMYLVWYCFCKMRRWWKFPGPHSRLQRTPWSLRRRKGKPDLISYLDHFHSHSRWLLFFLGTVGWSLSYNGKISQPNNIFSLISIDIAVNHHPIVCSLWWLQPVFPTNFWHKYIEYSHSDNRKWTNWPFCICHINHSCQSFCSTLFPPPSKR